MAKVEAQTPTAKEVQKMALKAGVAKFQAEQNIVYRLERLKTGIASLEAKRGVKGEYQVDAGDLERMYATKASFEACIAKGRYW